MVSLPASTIWADYDLTSLSLEQLLNTTVTSVSKTTEKRLQAPAAIYVITQEDIRRSGVTTLAEALRLAPGVDVARINSNQWAVGIRGFNSGLSRSTLVLIDGRSVYTPLFAGTYWDVQDTMLEDVDRIEVIRGPGGALWGANAVNGVINIITKNSHETQGSLATAGGGTEEKDFVGYRYGGKTSDDLAYRFYGKYFDRDASHSTVGDNDDGSRMGQAGFRTDWQFDRHNSLTFQGDTYKGREDERVTDVTYTAPFAQTTEDNNTPFGGNVLGRWKHEESAHSNMALQFYYDRTDRNDPDLKAGLDTFDLDFQHSLPLGNRHALTYGTGYRVTADHVDGIPAIKNLLPADKTLNLWSAFVQDQITVVPERLNFTLGSKVEHNDYTGWEFQPNGRLAWTPTPKQTLWSSVSRAVRTPSRVDRNPDIALGAVGTGLPPPFPAIAAFRYIPNEHFRSETILAYELGYRVQPSKSFYASIDGFFNRYDHLQSINILSLRTESDPPPDKFLFPFVFENGLKARVYGGELDSVWNPLRWWRLEGTYSYLRLNEDKKGGTLDGVSETSVEGSSPRHQVMFRSSMDLHSFEIDPMVRYVSGLPAQKTPAYWTMDLHLGWHARRHLELALVGQNLFQARHPEFGDANEIQRGVYVKATQQW
jgi:iron complex outermembrane receptor protein